LEKFNNSKIDKVVFRNRDYFIKRDDLIDYYYSGNKARKLYYYLTNDFPQNRIISFGGIQSNNLLSLSALAKAKEKELIYYTKTIPQNLKANPIGNYKHSINLGTKFIEIEPINWDKTITNLTTNQNELIIKQGGAEIEAEFGVKLLAREIEKEFANISIFLPSGTGTTALYLQKNSKFRVYTTPLVGDNNYLKKQFLELEKDEKNHPIILDLDKKYHFGNLYQEFLDIYLELKTATTIEFDLLYDPKGWLVLDKFKDEIGEVIYIHCGGILGNESQLERYKRKFTSRII